MKYILRLLMFFLKNLVLIMVVGALLVIAFTFAMDASNVFIIANDGMEMRAGVVLGVDDPVELTKFFTRNCLENDSLLRSSTYTDYNIRAVDYRAEIEWLWAWPWDSVAEVTITEHIPVIDGELPVAKQSEEQRATPGKILPPAWNDARYKLTFMKVEGRWKISELTLVEAVEPLATRAPVLTPPPSDSPSPSATATPETTPTQTAASPAP